MYLQGNINIHSWQTVDGIDEAVTVYYAEYRVIVPSGDQFPIRRLSLYERRVRCALIPGILLLVALCVIKGIFNMLQY